MLTTRIQMLCRFSYGLASVSLCTILKTALFLSAKVSMPLSRTKKERKFIDVSTHFLRSGNSGHISVIQIDLSYLCVTNEEPVR